ncbi:hypothetical protein F2Q69_00049569 [Brassica cretica]|uniref:Uncharacterized protein n=1 Tax=Brassica cretica TaxID=69181 RepID=A0A8S9PTI5_BRACR|nr:hypothetical protein F2Q69_00049569 [Brassica cretica]
MRRNDELPVHHHVLHAVNILVVPPCIKVEAHHPPCQTATETATSIARSNATSPQLSSVTPLPPNFFLHGYRDKGDGSAGSCTSSLHVKTSRLHCISPARASTMASTVDMKQKLSSKFVGYIILSTGPKVFQKGRTSPELKIEEYPILWNSRKLPPYQEKLLQSPVYLKISRNNLLSTGPYLSMRENSNMVLFPEYKKAKEQHKKQNMPRRSDLNQARNVIKEFEHPSIQGRTMYSSVIGGSNEEGTWRSTDSAANTDGPATMNLDLDMKGFQIWKTSGTTYLSGRFDLEDFSDDLPVSHLKYNALDDFQEVFWRSLLPYQVESKLVFVDE